MDISHIIGAIAIAVIAGCFSFTVVNKKQHPERYKNEKGNTFNILFGGIVDDFRENPHDFYYQNSKHGRKHMRSFTDQFNSANEKRTEAMNKYIYGNNDEDIEDINIDDDTHRKYTL